MNTYAYASLLTFYCYSLDPKSGPTKLLIGVIINHSLLYMQGSISWSSYDPDQAAYFEEPSLYPNYL